LLLGADHDANRRALEAAFSPADARADAALGAELAALREDLAPAWLTEPESLEATAERWIRPALQEQFVALCRGSVVEYLDRFGFVGQRLPARYAVTDGISGLAAGPDDPGTGHNFLAHNMCRLPGGDGTWMIVAGGMGTVGAALAEAARGAGAGLCPGIPVARIETDQGAVTGVATYDGRVVRARVVLAAGDPFRLPGLVGPGVLPADLTERLDRLFRPGVTMKVNLALTRPPRFPSLGNRSAGGATVHLLPGEDRPLDAVREMWREVGAGRLPAFPTIEWYLHTTVDGSLSDPAGRHSSACSRSRTSPPVRPGRPIGLLRRRLVGRVRPLRARHHGLGGGRTGAAAARDRAAFRHNRRPHPPRGQHVRLRRPDALCHRGTRALRGIGVSNPVASGN
jgi:phytoene dehydrogenase-like protein